MLVDRENWPHHRRWVIFCAVAFIAATIWFVSARVTDKDGRWPGGASAPGFTFGVVGGLIILFEFLLWFRKKVRVWRIGRAQAWMVAHIWLGLLCLPLFIYHSGFQFNGVLSNILTVLLIVVIASGVWGLILQQLLPRRMLDDLPAETIYSQIGYLSEQLLLEGEQIVRATCGPAPGEATKPGDDPEEQALHMHMVVGAVRTVGQVQGKVLETRASTPAVPDSEGLRIFFKTSVAPFLKQGPEPSSPMRHQARAAAMFQELKIQVPRAAHGAIDTLERMCTQRRQWALQARMHFWLHNWLWIHLPLSVALVVLMVVHAFVAIKYW